MCVCWLVFNCFSKGTFVDDLLSALMLTLFFLLVLYSLFQLMRATRWLSHRPWVQRLLRKTQPTSDLQLGALFIEVLAECVSVCVLLNIATRKQKQAQRKWHEPHK